MVPPSGLGLPPAPTGRRWELSGLTELVLALPWLWWSWLSIQFIGTPSTAVYVIAMIAWGAVAVGSLHPRVEDAMAWKVWRLRPPNALESQQVGPAWFGACASAGVDPNRYRVWIHEGPEATAPATAGSTVAVTSWAALVLPRRNLEAVLAHELAHRLALPRPVSLIVHALALPARVMAKAIRVGWRQPVLGVVLKFFVGFLMVGVIGVWALWGFSFYIVLMLSPLVAPFVVRAANRASEKYADRIALDLGYGADLAEVFTGREYQRAQSWSAAPQQSLKDSQPRLGPAARPGGPIAVGAAQQPPDPPDRLSSARVACG